eukprot:CAMPEP_0196659832 /NCGR_PEP_ID=MMETSP1086-20130531/36801_1 /TAXON_ID=77921 /ORGANISM="Cyanoptyche  gloeocystis , Strain SAG4.97" /LENGTH=117 /DNA_ID=CAMNT_0041993963 /DNA_START=216 /DNA_END=569 /DNA_ORIENTATION=+
MTEHRKHSPKCPFVLGLPTSNVPLSADERIRILSLESGKEPLEAKLRSNLASTAASGVVKQQTAPKWENQDSLRETLSALDEPSPPSASRYALRALFVQELLLSTMLSSSQPGSSPL